MNKPKRIQLKRKKGWRLPPNTVVVTRASKKWGNPFKVHKPTDNPVDDICDTQQGVCFSREAAVRSYKRWLYHRTQFQFEIIRELKGKNLACFCPLNEPCHADVILQVANHGLLRTPV